MIRITNNIMVNTLKRNMNINMLNLDKLQYQLATGRKINRPSDNPAGLVRSLRLRSDLVKNEQYLANIKNGINFMDTTDSAMDNINKVLQRIRELTVQGANGTNDVDARQSITEEINQLNDQLKVIANTTYGSKYIFSGSNVTEQACNGSQWMGNDQMLEWEIGSGVKIPVNSDMKNWFVGTSMSGANPSTDISTGTNDSFQITLDGDTSGPHLVQLANLGTDTDGAKIAADMQAAIRALSGDAAVDSAYQAAYARVTVSYTDNRYVIYSGTTDPQSSVVITPAPANDISAELKLGSPAGTETQGIFSLVSHLGTAIKNGNSTAVDNDLATLDQKIDQLLVNRAVVGAKTNRLELQQSRLESEETSYTDLLASNEDVDMAEVGIMLKMQENVYNASLAVGAKIIQPTLIDFLR